ncbi:MAG: hypothetical protein A2X54_08770 [Nitrospirae bacterium GWF2_44_13]|nr:MAG: hypothetical protein A2X54_08770 [Nitrospirae bacterium GWF2_44_13]OGW32734.1 MAG: hypothetical protein A2088_00585 [Nitrospirae bacterium GWD2_44_7]OGW64962.1 MAG: hypothetical protein A2222_04945 [Nitrospirae bacterium RIFOXYA2_FULL_44_9]OGW71980.1 MAG: hypothetical protein A2484_08465 [Nitrospirae bacterium RIFOXYC2_FULL_44_7]
MEVKQLHGSLTLAFLFFAFGIASSSFAEEHTFDISEIEKKPYHIGGNLELKPVLFGLDKNASLYKLKFYNRDEGNTLEEYDAKLQLEGSLEKGIAKLSVKTNTDYKKSYLGEDQQTAVYEGFLSIKPSSSLSIDIGKKALKWGKGYAWNPAAFIDRPKDPDDPELSLEGFLVASADYIKSFQGPLKTVSFTPVLIPVYNHVNNTFGDIDKLNFAGKLYFLFYDTDIDLIVLTGGSKTTRYGVDFSRNITTNLEIHGEFAFINDYKKKFIDSNGTNFEKEYDAKSYLIGMRYLTEKDTTYIIEYYRDGSGFTSGEMKDYFSFINKGYDSYISTGSSTLLKNASNVTEGNYGKINPMRDYIYLRVSQKEPFDILYFTPSVTLITNINDKSFSFSPELLYTGITNLELRLKTAFVSGERLSEYGEKQNDYRAELRVKYYF